MNGAGGIPSPIPTAPLAGHEQKRRDRATPKLQHTREQAERSWSHDLLRGQWSTGQVILRLGDTSLETLREAAGDLTLEERDWEDKVERSRYDEHLDEMEKGEGAEAEDEDWNEGSDVDEDAQGNDRSLYNF
ncbi:hypothetical protein NDU88_001341 [Pleurodeles waltl]|uniref:Uncharacterized protein n=1 Tax=Pleurodeles waltl TaxID=8319 RepID=A0AAV7L9I3_PLEWA|nr:hypothetical protein NDU88_001341 [Pleurodeles waltl]